MKTILKQLIADLKSAATSGRGNYGHRELCTRAAAEIDDLCASLTMAENEREWAQKRMHDANESARAMVSALKLAEQELTIVEREIGGLAPEAQSKALPMIRNLLRTLQ